MINRCTRLITAQQPCCFMTACYGLSFNTNFMIVSELIEKLKTLPQDKQVVLCDLQNDGDGDGMANLYEIVSVDEESVLQKGKKTNLVMICYNE